MDFNFDRKLTDEEIKSIEDEVNNNISANLEVRRIEMSKEKAEKIGAQMEFGQKYPDRVTVYTIAPSRIRGSTPTNENCEDFPKNYISAEFCGGPHVSNTSELGENGKKFKITGQESVGSGLRRIKASLI